MVSIKELKEGLFSYDEPDKGWIVDVDSAGDMLKGAENVKKAGVKRFDTFSPFPVHGLEKVLGIKRSWLTLITLIAGITGASFGLSAIYYIDVIDYPVIFGGKPYFSWPAYVPILFELTILFAAFATVGGVLKMGKLGLSKTHRRPPSPLATCDMFSIWIGDDISKEEVKKIMGNINHKIHKLDAHPLENGYE
ncbi:MAG: DUF3341 domain-containing protein [Spirochaetia bacterium]|nr:DUF3341 domain-containing protein [Spirochaetia bacterium]